MVREPAYALASAAPIDWVQVASVAGLTAIIVFLILVIGGFAVLTRRRRQATGADSDQNSVPALAKRANILLVRVDEAIKSSEDELGFATAQFGDDKTREFSLTIASAKRQLTEAFSLQQRLDDAVPESETRRREWNSRIIHLCESARAELAAQADRFDDLRQRERNAPQNLVTLRSAVTAANARFATAESVLGKLRDSYADSAIRTVTDNLDRARESLATSTAAADAAETALEDAGTAVNGGRTAAESIRVAEDGVHRAQQLLDAIDTAANELDKASAAVAALVTSTTASLDEARTSRDSAPDADAGATVNEAIALVDRTLAELAKSRKHTDPVAELDRLREANAALDTALAGARNQQRRLDAARTALTGALVAARSQLATTSDFIDTRRSGVGPEARTRLAEARRLLTLAEAESDPVTALDTARSSATHSRDADALARYDVMQADRTTAPIARGWSR